MYLEKWSQMVLSSGAPGTFSVAVSVLSDEDTLMVSRDISLVLWGSSLENWGLSLISSLLSISTAAGT